MRKIIIIIGMILILPISIKAECGNSETSRYKTLASHINNYYEFNEETKKFNIKVYNINNEFSILNKETSARYETSSQELTEINITDLAPGQTVTLVIYPTSSSCSLYRARTIYVNLPYYNPYYTDNVCKNNSNQLCSKWANTSYYSYEQFVNKVKIETKQPEVEKPPKEKIENKYGFFDFLADYYILMLLMIIASGSYGIYVLDKKSKFDF